MGNKVTMQRTLGIVAIVVVALIVVFSSYAIVGPGGRGVVIFLGNVEEHNVLDEGFHLVIPPMARQVVEIDVRTKKLEMVVEAASSDLQTMLVTGVLNYHVNPQGVGLLYQEVGLDYESIIIAPALQEAIKAETAGYRVEEVLVKRTQIKQGIQSTLADRLAESNIVVDQFSMANVEFSQEFNLAIERKQIAEQEAQQKEYELQAAEKDIEIAVARAQAQKESAIKAAEGRAAAREIEAKAEAEALALIAEQLNKSPELIQYEWAVKLGPTVTTVLLPSDQGLIMDAGSLLSSGK